MIGPSGTSSIGWLMASELRAAGAAKIRGNTPIDVSMMNRKAGSSRPQGVVDAVIRALAILEELAGRPDGAGVTELASLEEVNRALTHRALASLIAAGFASQDPKTSQYRLNGRLLSVAVRYYRGLGLHGVATPMMQRLSDETGSHVELSRFSDDALRLVLLTRPQTRHSGIQIVSSVGDVQPAHATASGKVWLASLSGEDFERFLNASGLPRLTPHTIVQPSALRRQIAEVQRRGYAFNRHEDHEFSWAVAAPIRGGQTGFAGILGITRPTTSVEVDEENRLAELAVAAADELAGQLPLWAPLE
jgi:DNA-binding IclR family transcriptional regulator